MYVQGCSSVHGSASSDAYSALFASTQEIREGVAEGLASFKTLLLPKYARYKESRDEEQLAKELPLADLRQKETDEGFHLHCLALPFVLPQRRCTRLRRWKARQQHLDNLRRHLGRESPGLPQIPTTCISSGAPTDAVRPTTKNVTAYAGAAVLALRCQA
eukprot:scaffold2908_cov257-Pinguiococcus_pyrenoidosus.AAC.41